MKRFLSARAAMAAVAGVSALAAAACAVSAPRDEISGTSWRLERIDGQPVSGPSIEFAQDRLSGSGGCNRFFGGYSADSGSISVSGVGSTRMACGAEIMRVEADFFAVLNAARSYRRDGDLLILADVDGRELALRPR